MLPLKISTIYITNSIFLILTLHIGYYIKTLHIGHYINCKMKKRLTQNPNY